MEYQPAAPIMTESTMRSVASARIRVRIDRFLNMAKTSEVRGVPRNQALKQRMFSGINCADPADRYNCRADERPHLERVNQFQCSGAAYSRPNCGVVAPRPRRLMGSGQQPKNAAARTDSTVRAERIRRVICVAELETSRGTGWPEEVYQPHRTHVRCEGHRAVKEPTCPSTESGPPHRHTTSQSGRHLHNLPRSNCSPHISFV